WLGEDHLEKGGTKLAPHSLSHNRPPHSTHTQGPQATWHPPLGTKAAKVGCHVLLSVAATPSKPSRPNTRMRATRRYWPASPTCLCGLLLALCLGQRC